MQIHITSAGETAKDIAINYEINEKILRNANELDASEPTIGEEILILKPTREYKVQFDDTVDKIALRFGIRRNDIFQNNPWIIGRTLDPGEVLMLKTKEKKYGMSTSNGYYYKGCSDKQLNRALPYLTYVTFASATTDGKNIQRTIDDRRVVNAVNMASKIPLLRIHDRRSGPKIEHENFENLTERIIEFAMDGGYKGIVLSASPYNELEKQFSEFLVALRKLMIGCDLILITEINEKSPIEFSEYADGSVMYYPKFAHSNMTSFDDGEKRILTDFACRGESAKTFVDLPALASYMGGYSSIGETLTQARKERCEISQNKSTLLSHFRNRKQGDVCYTSMNNIGSVLDLINELGYMGVCFDIMRTPLAHYLMYNSLFKTSYHTNVRSREGCSRGVED